MRLAQRFLSDIPFARDDANRLLPAMIACLVSFAALLLVIAMTLSGTLAAQSRDVSGMIQVEIPAAKASESRIRDITELLRATEGVHTVTPLDTAAMERLLQPWLGDDFTLDTLPVPFIIDVKTAVNDQRTAVDVGALTEKLRAIDRSIAVNDRAVWVGHLAKAVVAIQTLVLLVAGLLLACVVGMIVLVAKTNLRLHFKTVSLLHMFGATDDYILHQFQWNGALLAGRGALIGVAAATVVFFLVVVVSNRWASPVLPPLSFELLHVVMLVALPVFTALTALLATRFTVQSMLQQMH